MTNQDLEVGGVAVLAASLFIWLLNWRLKVTNAKLNEANLKNQELQNKIDVDALNDDALKSEFESDIGEGPSNGTSKPSAKS